jgi:predicted RNA-binding protein with PIN domain
MALVRILVDGYSLLHNWPELAPGRPRHSAAAREELIDRLTQYHDASSTPITVVFDGESGIVGDEGRRSASGVEVLFSRAGQTADQMIERAAHRLLDYGEVLVVTDDYAERDTIASLGGLASSCSNFVQTVDNTLAELARDIKNYNRRERGGFDRAQR